jgi:Flp pilus assembly protein TadG
MRNSRSILRRVCGRRKRGTAVVEFAVVLPLLILILFGIIEFGWLFLVRQTLVNAAREGCRVAVLRTATDADVTERVREVMNPLGFAEGSVWSFTATPLTDTVQLVRVTASVEDIALTGGFIISDSYELAGECSMRKEGTTGEEDDGAV